DTGSLTSIKSSSCIVATPLLAFLTLYASTTPLPKLLSRIVLPYLETKSLHVLGVTILSPSLQKEVCILCIDTIALLGDTFKSTSYFLLKPYLDRFAEDSSAFFEENVTTPGIEAPPVVIISSAKTSIKEEII